MFEALPAGLQVTLQLAGSILLFALSWAMLIGLVWAIRSGLYGFLYHMEDTT